MLEYRSRFQSETATEATAMVEKGMADAVGMVKAEAVIIPVGMEGMDRAIILDGAATARITAVIMGDIIITTGMVDIMARIMVMAGMVAVADLPTAVGVITVARVVGGAEDVEDTHTNKVRSRKS